MPPVRLYSACPKCRHTPLPDEQAFPAVCPGCGVILAKIGSLPPRPVAQTVTEATLATRPESSAAGAVLYDVDDDPPVLVRVLRFFFHVPEEVDRSYWLGRIAGFVLLLVWTYLIWRDMYIPGGDSGSRFLHLVLTPFHEAGHYLIFRWFGSFIMILGGTLGQHLLPVVLGAALLWKRKDPYGAALFLWLLGYSISDMGVYMYDALDPQLMLLDGRTGADSDGHDWQNIFGDLGLLKQAERIGLFFGGFGKVVMAAGIAWAALMLWLQKSRLSDSPFAETDMK